MSNVAAEIVKAVDVLKKLISSAGLNPDFYIEFNDNFSGRRMHAFLVDGLQRSSDPGVWPQSIPEYRLLSRDEAVVNGVKLRWPIQVGFPAVEGS